MIDRIKSERLWRVLPVTAALAFVVGCGTSAVPQQLTNDQAQSLAIMRFQNYSRGTIDVQLTTTDSGVAFAAKAIVDLAHHAGYGEYTATMVDGGTPMGSGLVAWNQSLVETSDRGSFASLPGEDHWTGRGLQQRATDLLLELALNLGSDRPENPALLAQSSARLLGTHGSGGSTVWEISGPGSENAAANGGSTTQSKTTYWIDTTGHLQKMDADLGQPQRATIVVMPHAGFPDAIPKAVLGYLRVTGSPR